MKKYLNKLTAICCVLAIVLAMLPTAFAAYTEQPLKIKSILGVDNYEIVASARREPDNPNGVLATYVVRIPASAESVTIIPDFEGYRSLCWVNESCDDNEFTGAYIFADHKECTEDAEYVPWEKANLYNFYGIEFEAGSAETGDYKDLLVYVYRADAATESVKRDKLQEAIAKVTGENAPNYYHSDDRYNGKKTSKNGF